MDALATDSYFTFKYEKVVKKYEVSSNSFTLFHTLLMN